jgi:hypothetical protein
MIATCHPSRFAKARGMCANCYAKWLIKTNPDFRLSQFRNSNEWKLRHPVKWKVIQLRRTIKVKADPLYRRERALMKKYGMTLKDYDDLLKRQDGGCALCYRKPSNTYLHVDHDHVTKQVRGLLCHQCNWYLGVVEKDISILLRIKTYLGACEKVLV